MYVNMFNV